MRKINIEICDGFLSMVRKKFLEVYGTTQLARKVDVRFREEADYIYMCEKYAKINNKYDKIRHNQNLNEDIPICIKMDIYETFSNNKIEKMFIGNKYFNMYDTRQIIKIEGLDKVKK